MVSGWTVAGDPVASIFAQVRFCVCTRSCRKMAEELGAGFPFSQTPPSLCSIARLESWVNKNVGKMTIIRPQTSLRHSNKKTPPSPTSCWRKNNLQNFRLLVTCVVTERGEVPAMIWNERSSEMQERQQRRH